jgi:CRISPR-associated protein Csb1
MASPLSIDLLSTALANGHLALRRVQRLTPAGGASDKVFPPTYEGGVYALESRVIDGRRVPCVLLDSVQSQANRIEQALKDAFYHGQAGEADIPVVTVDFALEGLPEVGEITSLDAPHRLADAILRDSLNGETRFRDSPEGRVLNLASNTNATGLFGLCPTALILGLWDSTGPRGGLGVKFQRCLVSEIVGVDVEAGVRPSSRVDPLGIERSAADIYRAADGKDWTIDLAKAQFEGKNPVRFGKEGKPSEINHGNVTPSLRNEKGQLHHGGVSMAYAQQTVVISLAGLRRLRFPDESGVTSSTRDLAARTALAALAAAGAQLAIDRGCDLRSRCVLTPDPEAPSAWELVDAQGKSTPLVLEDPASLVRDAGAFAAAAQLPAWKRAPLVLRPRPEFAEIVRRSREAAASTTPEA